MDNQFSENGFIPKHGGYRNLLTYQKAEIILLGTMYFCEKYISKFDRTYDQMVQAARSGERNILEGSMASGTSKETEIKLTNVARASLDELRRDYEVYLITRKHKTWGKDHTYYAELSKKHRILPQTYDIFQKGIESDNPEVAANVLLSLIIVTMYLLTQQLKRLEQDFLKEGGLRERMTKARIEFRKKENIVAESQKSTTNDATISMELVKKMVEWDKDRKTLEHWQWNTMKLITEGTYPLSGKYVYGCLQNFKTLKEAGFEE